MTELNFTPGDAMFVAHTSVVRTTGSGEPAVPTATLEEYNVNTSQQLLGIRDRIRNNSQFGLPAFNRSIDANALRDIATDTVLQNLADLIFFQSFPVSQPAAMARRSGAGGAMERMAEAARENPAPAMMVAAAVGMVVGFLLGSRRR